MVRAGDADAAICGVEGGYMMHLHRIRDVLGCASGVKDFSALSLVITAKGHFFLADTQVRADPTAEEIAEMAVLAAAHVRRFGLEPNIALVSHSNFGSFDSASARKMRRATELIWEKQVDFAVDGEMHADSALDPVLRERVYPHSRLKGAANVLIFPNLDAANIAYESIKVLADALPVGPILIGGARPAHILTPSVTARGIVNMTAVAVVEAQAAASGS
jgi:malate dehydrogenase (oxaloacetate-decarboxylating)(NADP+)